MTIFLKIKQNGYIDEISYYLKKNTNIPKCLLKYTDELGEGTIELVDTFEYQHLSLIVYSWRQGECMNTHRLKENYYGNIFILCKCNEKYVDIDVSDYSIIYNELYNDIQMNDTIESSIIDDTTLLKEDTTIY